MYVFIFSNVPFNLMDISKSVYGLGHSINKYVYGLGHSINKSVYGLGHSINKSVYGLGHSINKSVYELGHSINKSVYGLGHSIYSLWQIKMELHYQYYYDFSCIRYRNRIIFLYVNELINSHMNVLSSNWNHTSSSTILASSAWNCFLTKCCLRDRIR